MSHVNLTAYRIRHLVCNFNFWLFFTFKSVQSSKTCTEEQVLYSTSDTTQHEGMLPSLQNHMQRLHFGMPKKRLLRQASKQTLLLESIPLHVMEKNEIYAPKKHPKNRSQTRNQKSTQVNSSTCGCLLCEGMEEWLLDRLFVYSTTCHEKEKTKVFTTRVLCKNGLHGWFFFLSISLIR